MALIYVVDDRPINRQFLVTLLGYSGHTLAEACDGAEALALVRQQVPDLIILDIVMPNMDGREFVAALQQRHEHRAIPVIFYTATYRSEEARTMAREAGVKWVLPKPSDPQLILGTVAQALGEQGGQLPYPTPADQPDPLQNGAKEKDVGETRDGGGELQLIQMQAMTLKLMALVEAGIDMGGVRDPERLVELYCRAAQDIITAKYAGIRILDEGGRQRYLALSGLPEQEIAALQWPGEPGGIFSRAVAQRRTLRLNALKGDNAGLGLPPGHPPLGSIIVVPLSSPSCSYGWLYVADRIGCNGFSMDDERIAVTIGAQFSLAFENSELCDRVQLHASQLQQESMERLRAVEELRQKEQLLLHQSRQAAMGEMINNIAHQWRQPLNAVTLLIQQMSALARMGNLAEVDAVMHKSMKLISHMSQTVDDFRNFLRPDKEMVLFKVNQVLARAVSLIEGGFNELGVQLETSTQGDPLIYGYPNEYAQALLNILTNARDALHERRVERPRVTINCFSENGNAVITIGDNAGGIPAQVMPRIFDPYFTTKAKDKGTGVGLFMSRTIIENNMNGTLTARNTGEGAEFRIEVPSAIA